LLVVKSEIEGKKMENKEGNGKAIKYKE